MKNVLLLGDSIRIGYDKSVKKTLEGKANVIFPAENCRFAAYTLCTFTDWITVLKIDFEKIDLIHWNTGLWDSRRVYGEDVQTPVDIYAYYIERICERFKHLCPNAKCIFATSTSIIEDKMPFPITRYNKDIEAYNAAAVEVVKKYGHQINDLYSFSKSLPEEAHSDAVHFYTPIGTEAFTNQVLKHICSAIGIDEELTYHEDIYTDKPVGI